MIVIFSFSAKPAPESNDISLSVGMQIGQTFVPEFETWSVQEQEAFAEAINHPVRKCAHALEYAVLGFLLSGTIIASKTSVDSPGRRVFYMRQAFLAFAIAVAYAVSDEIHQLFVPGRAGMLKDVLIDSSGAIVGVVVFSLMVLEKRDRNVG